MAEATKRETELELELWRERANSVKNAVSALNLQAALLEHQSKECAVNVLRLTKDLEAFAPPAPEPPAAPPQAPDAS